MQQTAAAAGINLNLIQPPADTYWSSVWIQKPLSASGWDMRPVPDLIFSIAFRGGADWNETRYANERSTSSCSRRAPPWTSTSAKEMYCEMQRLLHDDGGHITLAFRDILDAKASNVRGVDAHPSGPLGFYQFAQAVWIDS